jgi:hypothetical protein
MMIASSRMFRVVCLALCAAGLTAVLFHGRAAARRDVLDRAEAKVEYLLFGEIEFEARRLGVVTNDPEAHNILRARARYEAGLFARALADDMDYLDPVIEARLLELLGAELARERPTSQWLRARARELDLFANDPVLRRRLINKRMALED